VIRLRGDYYDGRSSRAQPCELEIQGRQARLAVAGAERLFRVRELQVSERIGSIPRRIRFPDGAQFETPDNDAVDAFLAAAGEQRGMRLLHVLESRWRYVAVAAVALVAAIWGAYRYGIPLAAHAAAFALPAKTSQAIGQGALELMDRTVLSPSALDARTQARLRALFAPVAREAAEFRLALEFRRGGRAGANAFALPSGTIVVTDELVKLARHDGELSAVFAHEVGHIVHRHALRRVLQDSAVALVALMVTGDVSSTSTIIAALPALLIELEYSRAFEREADAYALAWMGRHGVDCAHLQRLLARMEAARAGRTDVPGWLSTHPPSGERGCPQGADPGTR
jgi:Zn-dependent protease with chaperone function